MPEPKLIPLADFRRGTRTNPAWQRASQGAGLDMVNIGVEGQGRPVPRLGYVVDETLEVDGLGDQLIKVHELGNSYREPVSHSYRIFSDENYINHKGRLFISGRSDNKWIDLQSGNVYDWGLESPELVPSVTPPRTLPDRDDVNIIPNVFTVVYTFESIAFGFETPPSKPRYFIWETYSNGTYFKDSQQIKVLIPNQTIPKWTDRINIYMQTVPSPLDTEDLLDGGIENLVFQLAFRPDILNELFEIRSVPIRASDEFLMGLEKRFLKVGAIRLIPAGREFDFATTAIYAVNAEFSWVEADTISPPAEEGFNLAIPILTSVDGIEERIYIQPKLLNDYKPPPQRLSPIMLYAERIWGWDKENQFLRFSEIGQYDFFPEDFALELSSSGQSHVVALVPAPSISAFFVFKQDAIHIVRGSGRVSGLRMKSIADTDLDASGVILQHGTLSPRTIISGDNGIYFISRDKKLKYLTIDGFGNTNVKDVGIAIDDYLAELTLEEQKNLIAFLYNNCYHIIMPGYVLVLDIQKRYWTRLTWDLKDAFWSEGGAQGESILYAIRNKDTFGRFTNDIVRLYEGFDDGDAKIPCEWESQDVQLPYETNVTGVVVQHTSEPQELSVELYMDDVLIKEFTGTPQKGNHFRIGCYGYGHRARIRLKSDDGIPSINLLALEIP